MKCISPNINLFLISSRGLSDKLDDDPRETSKKKILKKQNFSNALSNVPESENEAHWEQFSSDQFSPDVIYDFDEERLLKEKGLWEEERKVKDKVDLKINEKRGKTGVFDPDELVSFLRNHKARDVVVIHIPPELKFVDYLVLATGRSSKQISVLGELMRQAYKKKKSTNDDYIKIEGKIAASDWLAIDMGNIALHIMSEEIREEKDIECLWTVGPEYDDQCRKDKENPYLLNLVKQHQMQTKTSPHSLT